MKKTLSFLLSFALILTMLPVPVLAASDFFTVDKTSAKPGETITVEFTTSDEIDTVGVVNLKIPFDKNAFEPTSIAWATIGSMSSMGTTVAVAKTSGVFSNSYDDMHRRPDRAADARMAL